MSQLEESKIKLDQEGERLQFQLIQAKQDGIKDFHELLKEKTRVKDELVSKIDKFSKRENIIIKVL